MRRAAAWLALAAACAGSTQAATLTVGSKRFTESYILAEVVAQTARAVSEATVEVRPGLGNTAIVFAALRSGAIDVYPEYTGTLALEILRLPPEQPVPALPALNAALAPLGLQAGMRFGFVNGYALAMRADEAQRLGIDRVSQLAQHPQLGLGLSQEFLHRRDGWPGVKAAYGLPFAPRGLDHGLAYEALADRRIDVMDVYSTDAKIVQYHLRVLADDRHFFPEYEAVLLYRSDLPQRLPRIWAALQQLQGTLSGERMTALNAAAELDRRDFASVAADFVQGRAPPPAAAGSSGFLGRLFAPDFWRLAREHLVLVASALLAGIVVGVPLGWWASRAPRTGFVIFSVVGVLQTIPALALLAFLVAALNRIGALPALLALFLYALLPIVRNAASGFAAVPPGLRSAALALGLRPFTRWRLIELPLALPTLLAGIKTSAVISIGTATIAAFIGAGGFGERIVAGLAVNDNQLLLAGAVPAAAMALITQLCFDVAECLAVSPGLRRGK